MKRIGNVLSWTGVSFLVLIGMGAFIGGDVLSGVILELVAIAMIPVSPIKDLWLKLPEKFKWVKAVSLVVLFLIGMGVSSPAEEAKVSQPETSDEAIVTQEEKDEKKPAFEKETEEASEDAQKAASEKEENKKEELPPETTTKTPDTTTTDSTENIPVTTTQKPSVTTTKVPVTTTKAPVTTTTKAPTTTTRTPATTTTVAPIVTQTPTSGTVYITKTGKKYHSTSGCSGLSNAKTIYEATLEEAQRRNLGPCSKCY